VQGTPPLPFLVNQTRWSDLLKQLSVAKGLDHVEVLGQLVGAIVLENDRPEHKYLAGEQLAWGQFLQAAIAAVTGFVGLRNPSGSGKIVIAEYWEASSPLATPARYYAALVRGATLTQANTEQPRDTRIQPTGAFGTAAPQIAGQIVSGRSDTIAVTPFVVAEYTAGNQFNRGHVYYSPLVLAPGDALVLSISDAAGGQQVNFPIQGQFVWRERTLEPTET
jgi:hypothetical protein